MIYRLRCRLGVWLLKWHITALLEHYERAKSPDNVYAATTTEGEATRRAHCDYIRIGLIHARSTPFQDARRTDA